MNFNLKKLFLSLFIYECSVRVCYLYSTDSNKQTENTDFDWVLYQNKDALKPGEDKFEKHAYNQEISAKIPWDREVPDTRTPECKSVKYDYDLPTTSVIICYHNEGRAALLRTVISSLNRTPSHLLKEIILVDDNSNDATIGSELLALPKVKVIRNEQREGLIRSRVKGADLATGDVLTFLDSHCEVNQMWIEPLLQSIKNNPRVIVAPIIDVVNYTDFEYIAAITELKGGFGWDMNFRWDRLPPHEEKEHHADITKLIKSPALAGGLFSIGKKWFEELGKYDMKMNTWGGENIEISLRAWQCGGEMYIAPCSRVGHVFRPRHPYEFPGGTDYTFQMNTRRAVEVWLDDYKKYYYQEVPVALNVDFGDISDRVELRKQLNCKSFQWYLDNVYPDLEVPEITERLEHFEKSVFDWRAYQSKDDLKPGEDKFARYAYNLEISQLLPWDRNVPDSRAPECASLKYDDDLPTTSVIICYHNEGRAALLRTIASILNRSPSHLLKEIILVDDYSHDPSVGSELLTLPKIKLIRNNRREGLIRSRVIGASAARGDTLTFVDSHSELNVMWLEPLMQSIKNNRKALVAGIIDVVGYEDFMYLTAISELKGGFDWNLVFRWDNFSPSEEQEHHANVTKLIRSPVIAGGLFSIEKEWFEELGKYDIELKIWGAENIEISLRAWMCGGEVYIAPCSRVGHVFRPRHPYEFPNGIDNTFQRNTRRVAEVWLDDYKKYYMKEVPTARVLDVGDLTERVELKKRLNCKSFQWYLDNIYPKLQIPEDFGIYESVQSFDWKTYQNKDALKPGEDKFQRHSYNQEISDSLEYDRLIPDVRAQECVSVKYDNDLPTTSVIICYHNEGRAALLRTVVSTLNRSPQHLLKEIILVDDNSDDPSVGTALLALPKVKVIRNKEREGLIRSRLKGADLASGEVLTFLDSHCEVNVMWLEPLLQSVKNNRKIVVAPIIDVLNYTDFQYIPGISALKGGFGWDMNFRWDPLPPLEEQEHHADLTKLIKSPALAGGLFSIEKKWFEELGTYDEEMNVWGGENIEISLRAWQCGGAMYIAPCSRVGHVFRPRHPYKFPGGTDATFLRNTRRSVEVWLDDYKKFYFDKVPAAKDVDTGDITNRMELRKKLNCESFQWYLDNVYPDLEIPSDVKTPDVAQSEINNSKEDTSSNNLEKIHKEELKKHTEL